MAAGIRLAMRAGMALSMFMLASPMSRAACLGDAETLAAFAASKESGFAEADAELRKTRALALLDCLGDPDPTIRDGLAYEGLSVWLRGAQLDADTRRTMLQRLSAMLDATSGDNDGLRKPFAALVLSEVARTDRIEAWMTPAERTALIDAAARYMETLRDYRGFDTREGWRHGVAHDADLLMQLALNPALDEAALQRILAAVASQMPAPVEHVYIYGEPQRLARPVLFVAQRGVLDEAGWTAWLAARVAALGDDPATAWREQSWLARRHALMTFLQALYVEADASDDARLAPLRAGTLAALKAMP